MEGGKGGEEVGLDGDEWGYVLVRESLALLEEDLWRCIGIVDIDTGRDRDGDGDGDGDGDTDR